MTRIGLGCAPNRRSSITKGGRCDEMRGTPEASRCGGLPSVSSPDLNVQTQSDTGQLQFRIRNVIVFPPVEIPVVEVPTIGNGRDASGASAPTLSTSAEPLSAAG